MGNSATPWDSSAADEDGHIDDKEDRRSGGAAQGGEREMESEQFLDAVADRLGRRFPQLAGEELRHIVAMAYEPLIDARVRLYLPLLVERRAINALAAPARANDQGDRGNGAGGRDPGPDVTVEITSGGMCADPFPNPDLGAMSEVA